MGPRIVLISLPHPLPYPTGNPPDGHQAEHSEGSCLRDKLKLTLYKIQLWTHPTKLKSKT